MSSRSAQAFQILTRWADRVERFLLTILVTGMVILAALQILLRNIWHTGLNWVEPLLGMALLWLTMLGALAAAGLGRHLAIDLVAALLPRRWSGWLARATSLFAAVVCVFLAWAGWRYVADTRGSVSAAIGYPIELLHASAFVCGVLIACYALESALTGRVDEPAPIDPEHV